MFASAGYWPAPVLIWTGLDWRRELGGSARRYRGSLSRGPAAPGSGPAHAWGFRLRPALALVWLGPAMRVEFDSFSLENAKSELVELSACKNEFQSS